MKVVVRYFASLREQAGAREETFEVAEGASLENLISQVCGRHPGMENLIAVSRFAVGNTYRGRDALLLDGDSVTIIPPVAGG